MFSHLSHGYRADSVNFQCHFQQVQYILERYLETEGFLERRDLATAARRIRAFWKDQGVEAPEIHLPSREEDDGRMERIQRILDGEE